MRSTAIGVVSVMIFMLVMVSIAAEVEVHLTTGSTATAVLINLEDIDRATECMTLTEIFPENREILLSDDSCDDPDGTICGTTIKRLVSVIGYDGRRRLVCETTKRLAQLRIKEEHPRMGQQVLHFVPTSTGKIFEPTQKQGHLYSTGALANHQNSSCTMTISAFQKKGDPWRLQGSISYFEQRESARIDTHRSNSVQKRRHLNTDRIAYGIGVQDDTSGLSVQFGTKNSSLVGSPSGVDGNASTTPFVSFVQYDIGTSISLSNAALPSVDQNEHVIRQSLLTTSTEVQSTCSLDSHECCSDVDCTSFGETVCVARSCISDGIPRITLSWYGDDALDVFVVTQNGDTLSSERLLDPLTGGKVETKTEETNSSFHVESIYFPMKPEVPLDLQYYVEPSVTIGEPDAWTITVNDERGEVARNSGQLFSPIFEYTREESTPALTDITDPNLESSQCDSRSYECCVDSDCLSGKEVCANRNCIDDGNLRITLEWIGDDDLDLFVESPGGVELSFMNLFDPVSGGRFGEEVEQFGSGYHVENVYFPVGRSFLGNFKFFVRPFTTVISPDTWTISVVDRGSIVQQESGSGFSADFLYARSEEPTSPSFNPVSTPTGPPAPVQQPPAPVQQPTAPGPQPTSPAQQPTPTIASSPAQSSQQPQSPAVWSECSVFFDECCESADCGTSRDLCEARTCIRDGNPRFSLTWTGDDILDLYVVTPDGIEVSSESTFDRFSGGRFEMDAGQQGAFQPHVESIYFPVLGTPAGEFMFGVRLTSRFGSPDLWRLDIFEGGQLVRSEQGSEGSAILSYDRSEFFQGPQRPEPSPPRCSPISDECCLDTDCGGEQTVCVNRVCIEDGNTRVTLSWTGDDDLDLLVETPTGTVLSRSNSFDSVSGGVFSGSRDTDVFQFNVESISFPAASSPQEMYKFYVRSVAVAGVGADVWKVIVYQDNQEVLEVSDIGDSREFDFQRAFSPSQPSSPVVPTPVLRPTSLPSKPVGTPSVAYPVVASPVSERPPIALPTLPFDCMYECCSISDCIAPEEICVQRQCISEGSPRVTLTWTGNDDLDLLVVTPDGQTLSKSDKTDLSSGGIFGEESTQDEFGFHVENIFFPTTGGPEGEYSYYVKRATTRGAPDRWAIRVYAAGELLSYRTGTGDSSTFVFTNKATGAQPSPTAPSAPATPPSQAPVGSGSEVECESNANCNSQELCSQNTCIDEGNPRFTLKWSGNDDLDLVVKTPAGAAVSRSNVIDQASGGVFGENPDQNEFGLHVENIYLPIQGGPPGDYKYFVESRESRGSDDTWQVDVAVDGTTQVSTSGTGESEEFTFRFEGQVQPTLAPAASPNECDRNVDECCSDADCLFGDNVCVQRTCIADGNPRFTLTWTGDDDLDLLVATPADTTVSFSSPEDPVSGGIFGETSDQFDFDRHVENIFFPVAGAPVGNYTYYVRSFLPVGVDDVWTVSVYVGGTEVATTSGSGNSESLIYTYQGNPSTRPPAGSSSPTIAPVGNLPTIPPVNSLPTVPPVDNPPTNPPVLIEVSAAPTSTDSCDPATDECCSDTECSASTELCEARQCIDQGNPRFTLTWMGNEDLDLIVVTPFGKTVAASSPVDLESGGRFGENGTQTGIGPHVENIFFPIRGGPSGTYTYYVIGLSNQTSISRSLWTLNVYANDTLVESQEGRGDSNFLTYEFRSGDATPTAAPILSPSPDDIGECDLDDTLTDCCSDNDCFGQELCSQRTCINEGNPRFTLTWNGGTDYDLLVTPPIGDRIDFIDQVDPASGGRFGEGGIQTSPGLWVESIFFPIDGGPIGTYRYEVQVAFPGLEEDRWTVQVFEDGTMVDSNSGVGDSAVLTYEYATDSNLGRQAMQSCSIAVDECCTDNHCLLPNDQCLQRTCIQTQGGLRFVLSWTGDDDLDLVVLTPSNLEVSANEQPNQESAGRFQQSISQSSFGPHIESATFDDGTTQEGDYTFSVTPFLQSGDADLWTLDVYTTNEKVISHSGRGASELFFYDFRNEKSGGSLAISLQKCTNQESCASMDHVCLEERTCVTSGWLSYSLWWEGTGRLQLTVKLPGTSSTILSSEDSTLDGDDFIWESMDDDDEQLHLRHVAFTSPPIVGEYMFSMSVVDGALFEGTWKLLVHKEGDVTYSREGTTIGNSFFSYKYDDPPKN